jgi:multiple sugar transport system permease protein/putative aldouronate transport system permease protein
MKGEWPVNHTVSYPKRLFRSIKAHWEVYLMLVPPLAVLILFAYLPMVGIVISFENFSVKRGMFHSDWVGLKYYKDFVTSPLFGQLLSNTLILSLYSLLAGFPIPILLALAINEARSRVFKKAVQTITYAPYFISTVVLVGILMQFLHVHNGFINHLITLVGGQPINFMGNPNSFRSIYVWSGIWQTAGYSAIIYIAALSSVDQSQVEASIIDGATRIQKIAYVDLPAISPTIVILLILAMGNMMGIGFEKVYLMQNPLNLSQSEIISTYVYKKGLQNIEYAYATAIGVFNSVVNLILLLLANAGARKIGDTSLF